MTHGEIRLARRLGIFIPRTDQLAVVATVNTVADQGPQFHRYAARVLDGEVGNTASRIELIGGNDGLRRAHGDAFCATAAVFALCHIDRQRQIGKNFAQKKHRAGMTRQQQRMFAPPAQTSLARDLHLHHRRAIGKHAMAVDTGHRLDPLCKSLQACAQNLVIITPQRIA